MSASLVGSEMCIRDRCPAGTRRARRQRGRRQRELQTQEGCAILCLLSVSYTHLTLPTICSV
eukprot:13165077-Alexandrium_andersonii.AAC.1